MPVQTPAAGSQADTSYRNGGGSTSTANNAPASAGAKWAYAGSDADTLTQEDSSTDDMSSGVFAKIIKINDDGSADIALSDGRQMTVKTFNGQPIAVKKTVQSPITSGVPGSGKQKNGTYSADSGDVFDGAPIDPAPGPTKAGWDQHNVPNPRQNMSTLTTTWVPNPALPQLRQSKGAGGSNETWFDYTPRSKTKLKVGDVISGYATEAGSTDPTKKANFDAMRDKLFKAGLTTGTQPLPGGYSPEFEKALDDALNSASASGMTLDNYLDSRIKDNPNPASADQTGNALMVTSKTDIAKQVTDSATKVLGYQPPQSLIDHLTTQYNALETDAEKQQVAASAKGTGGTTTQVTNTPSLPDFIEGALRQSDPTAAQGNQMGNLFSEFSSLLGGSSPSPTTFGSN